MLFALACSLLGATPFTVTSLDPPTSLAGAGWECAATKDGPWTPIVIPQPSGDKHCSGADVWLRTRVAHAGGVDLGVSVGEVHGAYRVLVDGKEVGGEGSFDPLVDALRVGAAFPLPAQDDPNSERLVEVHVVRDPDALQTTLDRRAILDGPVFVGSMPQSNDRAKAIVDARVQRDIGASLATALLFFFVALYHLLVFALRRDLRGYLWFGVFAFVADAWITLVQLAGTPSLPLTARTAAVVGNLIGANVNTAFIEFFWWYLDKQGPPRRWRIYQALLVAVSLLGFVPHVGVAWTTTPPVVALKVLMPLFAVIEFVRAARKGSREARVLLVGLVLAAVGAPVQAWVQTAGIHTAISPGQASLAVFFTTMAVALAAQFARHMADAEARAQELSETNASIQRFVPHLFLRALSRDSVRDVKRGDAAATTMSVMFCDLRGFTTLAEKMGPSTTFAFINDYLARMEPAIHESGGFINQYLGDGIMALFPAGADAAVDAAVGMRRALERLNRERVERGEAPLRIGIGIHTGPLMLGTIGGGDQLDSGVVGDVVNTAARLEGITKMYGVDVLLSGATMTALHDPSRRALRPLDAVKAKGKTEALALVELLDGDAKKDEKLANRGELEAALAAYRKGKFDDAAVLFGALAARCPEDGVARAFAERCRGLVAAPPDAWDGVLSLTTK